VAGGVCGSAAAVAALPCTECSDSREVAYGAAVLGAGHACAEGVKTLLEHSQNAMFEAQIKAHADRYGIDPDAAIKNSLCARFKDINQQSSKLRKSAKVMNDDNK